MKSIWRTIVAGVLALGIGSSAGGYPAAVYGYFSQPLSSLEGGGTLVITNCSATIGNGSDITNVLFGSTATTNIQGQGTNWIAVVIPATNVPGQVSIKTSSQSAGQLTINSQNNNVHSADYYFNYLIKAIEGYPLMLGVSSTNGALKVYRKFGTNTVYTREYFNEIPSFLQLVNGTTTNRFSGNFTAVSNNMPDSGTINFVMDAGNTGVRITQVLRCVNGKNYFTKEWHIANLGATNYTDVRFIHGGDTYFANNDSACGYHNADLDMVYLKNTNAAGLMGFYGGFNSRSDRYYAGNLTSNSTGIANYWLLNSVNTNFTDAGYSLQWNTNSLAAGTEWTITAYEKWTDAGDVQVIAASDLSGALGVSVTGRFTVVNFQTNADVFGLSAGISQPGWTVSILDGTNLALASGAASNVLVRVTIGSRTSCVITLTAASQTVPSVTNSDSLTVSGPAKIDQTIGSFTPTNGALFQLGDTVGLAATASSGLPVGFTNSAGSPVNWLNATTITFTATGTVGIVASQAGDDNYNAAPSVTNMLLVGSQPAPTNLPAPTNVAASDGRYANRVEVTWDAVSGATGYQVWRGESGQGAGVRAQRSEVRDQRAEGENGRSQIGETAGTSFNDTNASPGVLYYYWVKAVGGAATSAFSEPDTGWRRTVACSHYMDVDIDGDGRVDPMVYDPETGGWYAKMSRYGYLLYSGHLGGPACTPAPGDYDGDRLTDAGVYEEATGAWSILLSTLHGQLVTMTLGGMGQAPVPGDYDGDRKTDLAVYRQATGDWTLELSASGYAPVYVNFGGAAHLPVQRDYDGDMKHDPAVYRRADGNWYFMLSGSDYLAAYVLGFGGADYAPAPGDYDGDRLSDPAVYHEGLGDWLAMLSGNDYLIGSIQAFGGPSHTAMPGDYDGDGKTDPAAYNRETGEWCILFSGSGYSWNTTDLGGPGEDPVGIRPDGP